MGRLTSRIATILRQPRIGVEYAQWFTQKRLLGQSPTRSVWGVRLSGFSGFSEYHSVAGFIDRDKHCLLMRYDFGAGDIIDVGANLGVFSLMLARRFPERRIWSFEPNPSTFGALCCNIDRNAASNVKAQQVAISDQDGETWFDANPAARGTAAISSERGVNIRKVISSTLDAFVAQQKIEKIALLKIDVEGFESAVLTGAQRVVSEVRPAMIFFEVFPQLTKARGYNAEAPAVAIRDAGYRLYRQVQGGKLTEVEASDVQSVDCEDWIALRE